MFSRYQQGVMTVKNMALIRVCLILILDHYLMHHRKFYNLLHHLWVLVLMCGHLVLMYAMIVGRLPFQHHYEPRLRAIMPQVNSINWFTQGMLLVGVKKMLNRSNKINNKIPTQLIITVLVGLMSLIQIH